MSPVQGAGFGGGGRASATSPGRIAEGASGFAEVLGRETAAAPRARARLQQRERPDDGHAQEVEGRATEPRRADEPKGAADVVEPEADQHREETKEQVDLAERGPLGGHREPLSAAPSEVSSLHLTAVRSGPVAPAAEATPPSVPVTPASPARRALGGQASPGGVPTPGALGSPLPSLRVSPLGVPTPGAPGSPLASVQGPSLTPSPVESASAALVVAATSGANTAHLSPVASRKPASGNPRDNTPRTGELRGGRFGASGDARAPSASADRPVVGHSGAELKLAVAADGEPTLAQSSPGMAEGTEGDATLALEQLLARSAGPPLGHNSALVVEESSAVAAPAELPVEIIAPLPRQLRLSVGDKDGNWSMELHDHGSSLDVLIRGHASMAPVVAAVAAELRSGLEQDGQSLGLLEFVASDADQGQAESGGQDTGPAAPEVPRPTPRRPAAETPRFRHVGRLDRIA